MSDAQGPGFDRVEISNSAFECDALRHMTVHSRALRGRADVSLFVPHGIEGGASVPIIILLHGVYGSHWAWFLQGGARQTVQRLIEQERIRPMLLVAPSDGLAGDGSGYLPSKERNCESWICDDLLACLEERFRAGIQRPHFFIAGLSMGGYGALRLGAKYPEKFKGISAHSAITKAEDFRGFVRDLDFLKEFPAEEADPFYWLVRNKHDLPPLRFDCGQQDTLFSANRTLHEKLEQNSIPHEFAAYPGGHGWPYWELHLADTLLFFEKIMRAGE